MKMAVKVTVSSCHGILAFLGRAQRQKHTGAPLWRDLRDPRTQCVCTAIPLSVLVSQLFASVRHRTTPQIKPQSYIKHGCAEGLSLRCFKGWLEQITWEVSGVEWSSNVSYRGIREEQLPLSHSVAWRPKELPLHKRFELQFVVILIWESRHVPTQHSTRTKRQTQNNAQQIRTFLRLAFLWAAQRCQRHLSLSVSLFQSTPHSSRSLLCATYTEKPALCL